MSDWIFDSYAPPRYVDDLDIAHLHLPTPVIPAESQQLLLDDDGHLTVIADAKGGAHGPPSSGGTGRTSGTGTTGVTGTTTTPTNSTLVGSSTGLQINLIWDNSVLSAPNAADIENAVVSAAQVYTSTFATHAVLNIQIGLGEVNGSALVSGALGESQTFGIAESYAGLTSALGAADANLVASGLMASGAVTAVGALAAKTFFVPMAEAKALGLVNATSTAVDGFIGLAASGLVFAGAPGPGQYDGMGVAAHEISEVMGRIGLEGSQSGYYTPLDLFRYTSAGVPDLTPTAGSFSLDMGVTALNGFNSPGNGGDAADWGSSAANTTDSYSAFATPGVTMTVTRNDLIEVAALGYKPTAGLASITV